MFDIKKIEEDAREELNEELGKTAKTKIKASLRSIAMAEKALMNLRHEHEVLMRDIGSESISD